jgi:hypothetical protein
MSAEDLASYMRVRQAPALAVSAAALAAAPTLRR